MEMNKSLEAYLDRREEVFEKRLLKKIQDMIDPPTSIYAEINEKNLGRGFDYVKTPEEVKQPVVRKDTRLADLELAYSCGRIDQETYERIKKEIPLTAFCSN